MGFLFPLGWSLEALGSVFVCVAYTEEGIDYKHTFVHQCTNSHMGCGDAHGCLREFIPLGIQVRFCRKIDFFFGLVGS